ncbi:HD-GYP domain-containing protein [Sulfurimonas sp.]|uniref:HD-GYP domain-containing protein n=1 Tax=Sulfurimonas sp. TaxID=2022749 RepID=UPI0035615C82
MNIDFKVQQITLDKLFKMSPITIGGSFVMMMIVGFLFYNIVPIYVILFGLLMHMIVLIYRAAICKSYSKYKAKITDLYILKKYKRYYVLGTFMSGIVWGLSVVLLFFEDSIEYQFFLYTVVVGLAGASVVTLSAVFQVYIAFIVPMLGISAIYAFMQEGDIYTATGIFISGLIVFFYISGRSYYRNLVDSIVDKESVLNTQHEVINRLSKAGEYRDNETGMHITRMSYSCSLLAKECGYSEDFATNILYASGMHDIGKIGIPDNILLKPEKLDANERAIMQEHVNIGKKILENSNSNLIKLSESIAYTHHEKYDGTGYPNSLKASDIPIEGRITAICDVFDALVSERPYKKAWSHQDAIDYITEESSKHFDPELVKKFVLIYPDIKNFYDKHA